MTELANVSTDRQTIRDHVARHPLVAFVALAYAISWTAWLLNNRVDFGTVNGFGVISLMGPALAAMIVSALLRPEPSGIPAGKRWRLFGIIGILAMAVMAVLRAWFTAGLVTISGIVATTVAYPSLAAFLMDILAAAVVAFILSGVHSPRQGVRDLLHSLNLKQNRVRWYWFVFALAFYPVVFALGYAISAAVGLPEPAPVATGPWYWLALTALTMLMYGVFGGGGLEEPGWRGFTLPLLQKRYSPLRSSLILAVIWAFWHWPFLQVGPLDMVFYLFLVVAPLTILFTTVFNRTGGSLPIVILLHTSINITEYFLPASPIAQSLLMPLMMLGMAFWMWRSPQTFSFISAANKHEKTSVSDVLG